MFWEKACIPVKQRRNAITKLENLFLSWQNLQKHEKRQSITQKTHEENFKQCLENLFDVAHANAFSLMTIEEDKHFLLAQREKGRQGCMGRLDATLLKKKKRKQVALEKQIQRQQKADIAAASKTVAILEDSSTSSTDDLTSDDGNTAGSSGVPFVTPKAKTKTNSHPYFIIKPRSCKCF